jgi:1-acyl-sn-glycerol-3-phosphate acyltransferase
MLMSVLRFLVQLILPFYFKRFYTIGLENVPAQKPFILAANHPNSFLDALVAGVYLYQKVHFLARGDVFAKKWSNSILRNMRMIPVYRKEEGVNNLEKNTQTFQECYKLFDKNIPVLIFSEGYCVLEKRMRPLKKGTARMALEAAARNNFHSDICIIPTGVNYTYPDRWGTEVFLLYGKPISVTGYQELYESSPSLAVSKLTDQLAIAMAELVIITPDASNDSAVEIALKEARKKHRIGWKWKSYPLVNRFLEEKEIAATTTTKDTITTTNSGDNTILKYVGFPIYFLGYLLHILPCSLSAYLTSTKVKLIEFKASVRIATTLVAFLLFYFLLIVVLLLCFPINTAILLLLGFISLGYLSNRYYLHFLA